MRPRIRLRAILPARIPRATDTQCQAVTRAGRRCRLPEAFPGAGACLIHIKPPTGPRTA